MTIEFSTYSLMNFETKLLGVVIKRNNVAFILTYLIFATLLH